MASGAAEPAAAAAEAMADCTAAAAARGIAAPCRLVARDATLGEGPVAPVAAAQRLGPFRLAPLLRRWGAAAKGVVIWSHGSSGPRGTDLSGVPMPGLVTVLNEAGWDVLRFDRKPGEDRLAQVLPRLLEGLEAVRAAGYRRIVLGGHSRGGWHSLLAAAERPEAVAAVIALAPAAWGPVHRNGRAEEAMASFEAALERLRATPVRLAVAVFTGDPYDPDPPRRAALVAALGQDRASPALALLPSMSSGHGGGEDWAFTRAMSGCLLAWLQQPPALAPRGLRREGCDGPVAADWHH
jgi:pimeloyl-ACP methyl ester carboxylesterase